MPVEIDSLAVIIIALFLLVTLGVLLGPSFLSRYENWKIKKGLKG
jgi:hypothetical protein